MEHGGRAGLPILDARSDYPNVSAIDTSV